ncbi:MerR family DNA-binding protein, partial [Alteromonas macleodii]
MKVREIASALATTPDTVRYYTRLQLITPAKSDNGYKFYSTKDASRLRFILSARHLGFSVEDIKQILREADNGKTACPLVRTLIARRLAETERQFKAMLLLRQNMML